MKKVTLKGYVLVPEKDLSGVMAELPKHIELTLKEKGCLVFQVTQDSEDKNRLNVYEEFIDREAFDFHQARAKSSNWGEVSKNLKKFYHIQEGNQ